MINQHKQFIILSNVADIIIAFSSGLCPYRSYLCQVNSILNRYYYYHHQNFHSSQTFVEGLSMFERII